MTTRKKKDPTPKSSLVEVGTVELKMEDEESLIDYDPSVNQSSVVNVKSSIKRMEARGYDKRSRPMTLRTALTVEEILTICAAAEQKDVTEFIGDLMIKYCDSDPAKNRMLPLRKLAASNGMSLENFVRMILEARFPLVDYDFESVSAIQRVLKKPIKDYQNPKEFL